MCFSVVKFVEWDGLMESFGCVNFDLNSKSLEVRQVVAFWRVKDLL